MERQSGELQGCDPTFGSGFEGVHVLDLQIESHRVAQVRRRLLSREPEIGCADLQELTTCSQARKRPRWVGPAGNDEVQPLGKVLDEEPHRVVHIEGLNRAGFDGDSVHWDSGVPEASRLR